MKQLTSKFSKKLIKIPTSKSYSNRILILASLNEKQITIRNISDSDDTKYLIRALKDLGLDIQFINDSTLEVNNSFPHCELKSSEQKIIDLGEGGTTIRFMLSLLALGQNTYRIKVHPRFKKRPYRKLLNLLTGLECFVEELPGENELCLIRGPLKIKSDVSVDCSKTTQNATSLMMVLNNSEFNIKVLNADTSKGYLDITRSLLANKSDEFKVPVDFSGASYFIALGSVVSSLCISGVEEVDQQQGDSVLINLINSIGGDVYVKKTDLIVNKRELLPFKVDISNCLDLAPTLAYLALCIEGESLIQNTHHLKYKEVNRLDAICSLLDQVEAKYIREDNSLRIKGGVKPKFRKLKPDPDHRIVMMAALVLKTFGGGEISNEECVSKSFPLFFNYLD